MERLTERYKDSIANIVLIRECGDKLCKDICDDIECNCSKCELEKVLEKLADYEDLEEQGLLVRLPCKVGDTVWVVTSPINVFDYDKYDGDAEYEVYESFLSSVSYYASGEQFRIYAKVTNSFIAAYFRECDFGESIFFTRKEAEKKLEEMRANA